MTTRLEISELRCTGHGLCYGAAPHLLTDDEEGYVAERGGVVEVGEQQHLTEAEAAVKACPEQAIVIVRELSGGEHRSRHQPPQQ